jgi:hypothetical protein
MLLLNNTEWLVWEKKRVVIKTTHQRYYNYRKKMLYCSFHFFFLASLALGLNNQTTHVSEFFFSSRNAWHTEKVGRCIPRRNRLATERVRGARSPVQRGTPTTFYGSILLGPIGASSLRSPEEVSAHQLPLARITHTTRVLFPPSTLHTPAFAASAALVFGQIKLTFVLSRAKDFSSCLPSEPIYLLLFSAHSPESHTRDAPHFVNKNRLAVLEQERGRERDEREIIYFLHKVELRLFFSSPRVFFPSTVDLSEGEGSAEKN